MSKTKQIKLGDQAGNDVERMVQCTLQSDDEQTKYV